MDPASLPSWAGIIGGTIAGVVAIGWAVVQAFNNGFSSTEKQKDQAAKDLVKILSATVETLKTQMKEMQEANLNNVKEIAHLRGENTTLLKVLQGRDDMYIKFQQEGFVAFKRIAETGVQMEKLLILLEKHFAISEPSQKTT